jgi:predicted amidohydrolase
MQLEHNFNKAANFIRSAAAQGAELTVLPEYHLTNWMPKDPGFIGLCDQWETYLQKYRDLARECRICTSFFNIWASSWELAVKGRSASAYDTTGIVPGTIVETHKENEHEEDKLLNVCYFINHEGNIAGRYVKKNLWYVKALFLSYIYFVLPSAPCCW